ncbi:hypothetical protein [Kingella sp. (in: b-proteobacteria)]|uniref:hypothetical protein n=1 Tax=Kingella sp. (in: b-proteobacteria) TaxID=2020713 RepID=UPI0026DABD91|nr:hypothetical protein [Kingella sp. (in: b-proteobacteria)]MDO4656563.1 hypothetical protein [Kingella sp. (in: b-proteobacteria)]
MIIADVFNHSHGVAPPYPRFGARTATIRSLKSLFRLPFDCSTPHNPPSSAQHRQPEKAPP